MPVVGPIKDTRVIVVYDTDAGGFGGPLDMNGPEVGRVSYSQPSGNLLLRIRLEFGQPNSKYEVFLVCGPSHANSCGFISIGSLATDGVGAGAASITVSAAVLQGAPFGPGFRNDHLDLVGSDKLRSGLTAGAINYFVCRGREGAAAAPDAGKAQAGDPLSRKAGPSNAKAGGKKR